MTQSTRPTTVQRKSRPLDLVQSRVLAFLLFLFFPCPTVMMSKLMLLKGSAPATDLFCLSADFGRGGEGNDGGGGAGFLTSPLLFLLLFLRGGALSPETSLLLLLRRRWWLLLTMRSSASVLRSSRLDCDLLLDLRSSTGFRSLLLASADLCRLLYR